MSIFRNSLSLAFLFVIASPSSFAQVISKDYQNNCTREQVAEHQGIKGKALTEKDFADYCACQADFINKNATNRQVSKLAANPKARPEWLKVIELKAMKACITDPKMST
jgi:hypothetical protein